MRRMDMILHSTNGTAPAVSFKEGIINGYAPDGGLYMPDTLPQLPRAFFRNIHEMSVRDVAYVVGNTLLGLVVPSASLKRMVDKALDFDLPMIEVGHRRYMLELYHGPSRSFKDVGALFMRELLLTFCPGCNRNIIMATTGDSGEAVATAFSSVSGSSVVLLCPRGEIPAQRLARLAAIPNVVLVEVDGTFDTCQGLVRGALLGDCVSNRYRLTSGNSINLARELPAIIYFFYAYAQALALNDGKGDVVMSVPCGNLGTLAAALMAKRMGLPVNRFIAANNANDVFVEYLQTGGFHPREALLTLARDLDVGNPANIARITDLYGGNLARLREDVDGYSYNDDETAETIRDVYRDFGIPVDAQSAIALRAMLQHTPQDSIGVALAGVDPQKNAALIGAVLGHDVPAPTHLPSEMKIHRIPPTATALDRLLQTYCR